LPPIDREFFEKLLKLGPPTNLYGLELSNGKY
jgi:hypothetical protein